MKEGHAGIQAGQFQRVLVMLAATGTPPVSHIWPGLVRVTIQGASLPEWDPDTRAMRRAHFSAFRLSYPQPLGGYSLDGKLEIIV